jgi:hypothetical protein
VKQKTHNIYHKIYKMTHEQLRMQMLSGIITEGEYKAIINKEIEEEEKASLNESMIGGIVGIGAINQIPSRAKADYEMAFEHFLGERYEVKPNRERDDIKDINEEEEMEGSSSEKRQMLLDKIHSLIPGREKEFLEFMGNSANSFEDYSGYSMDKLLDLFIDFEESENGEELTPEIADEVLDIYIPGFESGEGVF